MPSCTTKVVSAEAGVDVWVLHPASFLEGRSDAGGASDDLFLAPLLESMAEKWREATVGWSGGEEGTVVGERRKG